MAGFFFWRMNFVPTNSDKIAVNMNLPNAALKVPSVNGILVF